MACGGQIKHPPDHDEGEEEGAAGDGGDKRADAVAGSAGRCYFAVEAHLEEGGEPGYQRGDGEGDLEEVGDLVEDEEADLGCGGAEGDKPGHLF